MKFSVGVSAVIAAALFVAGPATTANAGAQEKVTICHYPPGNPDNAQVITIGESAVPMHMSLHDGDNVKTYDGPCRFGGYQPSPPQ